MEGTKKITKMGRLNSNLGSIIRRAPAIMNPKSEISPPKPSLHHTIISPQKAIRRQTTVAINKMSGGLE
jgi:hypothetical protein